MKIMRHIFTFILALTAPLAAAAQPHKDPSVRVVTRAQLAKLISQTPLNSKLHGRFIGWSQVSGLTGAAYVQYTSLWQKQPKNAYANLWRGITAFDYLGQANYPTPLVKLSSDQKARLWDVGESSLRTAVQLAPKLSWANTSYGGFLFNNKPDGEKEGLALLRKATHLDPKNSSAWVVLGDALINPYRSLKNPKEGEQALLRATKLDPLYASPHLLLTRFYVEQKRFKEAQQQLSAFVALVPPKDATSVSAMFKPRIDKGLKS